MCLAGAIAACDSPHPRIAGEEATPITVEGSEFSVRVKGDIAEAIRTNYAPRSDHARILLRAVVAIELATGCEVDQNSVKGDPALIVARIDCDTAQELS
jgi:hypothetical protein